MKKIFTILIFFFVCQILLAQAEYVPYDNPVYGFLERMDSKQLLTNYYSQERPKTRKQIAGYLKEVEANLSTLSSVDKVMLNDYKNEFEYEILGTIDNSESLINGSGYSLSSQKEKYLYSLVKPDKGTVFINLIGQANYINYYDKSASKDYSASYIKYGGQIRGTILNKFGYYIKGTNGKVLGEKTAAQNINDVKFSYKYNMDPDLHSGTDYIDNTEGYFNGDFDFLRFKIGRDRKQIGYGPVNYLLGDNIPQFDYVSFDIDFEPITFSYFHGKLLGRTSAWTDSIQGAIKNITDKYIGYHRFGFNISKNFSFGAGEIIVYSGRSLEFGYVNPFNFYKSVEHSDQDRDNSILFFDVMNNSIKGLKLFGSVLLDDMDFGKIGTGWYGNQLLYNFTVYSSNLYEYMPVDFYLQYIRCEPYVYTHRIHDNDYTSSGYGLAAPLQPNSDIFVVKMNYFPTNRLNMNVEIGYSRHGANEINPDGTIKKNVGGDILIGHREKDATEVHFLDGVREHFRSVSFGIVYQPIKNYYLSGKVIYHKNSLRDNIAENNLTAYLVFDFRI